MRMRNKIAAAALLACTVGTANAGVIGSSWLEISNLLLIDAGTGGVTEDVTILSGNRNGTLSGNLTGYTTFYEQDTAGATATLDMPMECIGSDCTSGIGENDTTTMKTAADGNYSIADMYISGSALGTGSAGMTRATVSGFPDTTGAANSEITNNILSSLTIEVDTEVTLFFVYDFAAYAVADISDDLLGTTSAADASTNFSITVAGTTVDSYSIAANAFDIDGFNSEIVEEDGTRVSASLTLGPGVYNVLFTQKSAANIRAVPEPNVVALLALGLLGMGMVAGLRKKA